MSKHRIIETHWGDIVSLQLCKIITFGKIENHDAEDQAEEKTENVCRKTERGNRDEKVEQSTHRSFD